MPSNSKSQCYFVQLQIDGYIDGDLSQPQQEVFVAHVQNCQACAQEFHYARLVQDAVLELPVLDCSELVLEPIHRLSGVDGGNGEQGKASPQQSLLSQIKDLFSSAPAFARYGLPVALSLVLAVSISFSVLSPLETTSGDNSQMALEPVAVYTPEEVFQALQDLNTAVEYLNQMSKRTEAMIGDRFLMTPLQDSINASFERAGYRDEELRLNDPI